MKHVKKHEMLAALAYVADVITSTMGPAGRGVGVRANFETIYQQTRDLNKESGVMWRDDMITKDGVTVARMMKHVLEKEAATKMPRDSDYNEALLNAFAASMLVDAANKTMSEIGDGTTTVSCLVYELYKCVLDHPYANVKEQKLNYHKVIEGMWAAFKHFESHLSKIKKDIRTHGGYNKRYLQAIATVSANNDEALGKLVSEAVGAVGLTGSVKVVDGLDGKEWFERKEGYTYPAGVYMESVLINMMGVRAPEVILEQPLVVIINKRIENIETINPVIATWTRYCHEKEKVMVRRTQAGNEPMYLIPLVIVVPDIEGSALTTVQLNLTKGTHPVYLLKMPMQGLEREQLILDFATACGVHQVFSTMEGRDISRWGKDFEHTGELWREFGRPERLVLSKNNVLVTPTAEGREAMNKTSERLQALKNPSDFVKERIARLECGMVTIHIAAKTVAEMGDRRELVDDAVRACLSAMQYGVIAGGGRAMQWVKCNKQLPYAGGGDFNVGALAVWEALDAPMRRIMENAYQTDKFQEISNSLSKRTRNYGYNVRTGEIVDMFAEGILDPAQMPLSALSNAISVVGQLLKMDYIINAK